MASVAVSTLSPASADEEPIKAGELLFCGSTAWDTVGRKVDSNGVTLLSPTRLRPFIGIPIVHVASGSSSCHCIALDVDGQCFTWGRNEKGQLGHGDISNRDRPTVVAALLKYKIVQAGAGRNHTVVVTNEGDSFAFGLNKHGQLGSGSVKNETESLPVKCLVSKTTHTACGSEFTVWLSSTPGATILSAGLPQYGQLGHGTNNEYNAKDSSVKIVYEPQPRPRAVSAFAEKTIAKVACGNNHTVAVDSNGFVYTWGFGGHGRLGHREQKDEMGPRMVEHFQRNNVLPPSAVVAAGSAYSACTAGGGQLYMWGRVKMTGDSWMYPKPVFDLSGWFIRCMDCGDRTSFAGADKSCISWGQASYGELGYGPMGPKSSASAKKVDILEGMDVLSVACGVGHSLIVVDRTGFEERLDKLDVYECSATTQGAPEVLGTKKSPGDKKRKTVPASDKDDERNGSEDGGAGDFQNGEKKPRGRFKKGSELSFEEKKPRGRPRRKQAVSEDDSVSGASENSDEKVKGSKKKTKGRGGGSGRGSNPGQKDIEQTSNKKRRGRGSRGH